MWRRLICAAAALGLALVLSGAIAGCEDDVKKTTKIEQTKESDPVMVSPGEEVVE